MLADLPAGAGAEFMDRRGLAVVNVERIVGELHALHLEALDLVLAHRTVAQAGRADLGAGADDALHQVKAFHLQRIQQDFGALGGHAVGQVEQHGTLAHGGTAGDEHELTTAQAAGHVVKVAVAGKDAPRAALLHDGPLHLGHDAVDHLAGGSSRVALAAHVHAQDALAGIGQGFLDINARIFGGGHHAASGVDDAAAGHVAAQDLDVVAKVAATAIRIHLGQHAWTADLLKLPKFTQPLGNGEQVRRSTAGADGNDCRQDGLVRGEEKVFGVQLVPFVDEIAVQHERADDVALGREVVGNGALLFHIIGGLPSSSNETKTSTASAQTTSA